MKEITVGPMPKDMGGIYVAFPVIVDWFEPLTLDQIAANHTLIRTGSK